MLIKVSGTAMVDSIEKAGWRSDGLKTGSDQTGDAVGRWLMHQMLPIMTRI